MNDFIEYLAEMLKSNHTEAWTVALAYGFMVGFIGLMVGYVLGQRDKASEMERLRAGALDEGITNQYSVYPLEASCRFVAAHLVASFMEGKKLDHSCKHALGRDLLEHWHHAHHHHGNRVKSLNSKQQHTLEKYPAVFYANNHASESFDWLIKCMLVDWTKISEETKNEFLKHLL